MKRYEIIATFYDTDGKMRYSRLDVNGKTEWKTKRIAEKHAREFKATHLRDSWVREV